MTELKYTNDTYCFEIETSITETGQDELGSFVQTKETILYPQGGGQPSDTGSIFVKNGVTFKVTKVLNMQGVVNHYGIYTTPTQFTNGDLVTISVESKQRIVNAINHTAGHLLSFVVESLYPTTKAIKGYHFPDGAYVEFQQLPDNLDVLKVEEEVNKKILSSIPIKQYFTENIENSINGKAFRVMDIEGLGNVGCGGTHVDNTSKINSFKIRKVKKGRISYTAN
jgi:Ser-tRNA(Ala) deacylase AlaX